jgi:hypothetical protein
VAANQGDYDFDVSGITKENADEMQEIKERAVANGTFMKAPNGKKSNLNERKWLQVRTAKFKAWFGDWLLKHLTVKNIFIDGKTAPQTRKEAIAVLDEMRNANKKRNADGKDYFVNDNTGAYIYVSNGDAKHSMMFRNDDQIKAVAKIDEMIKNAVKIGEEYVAENENDTTKSVSIYYVPVNIGGTQYSARMVVKEYFAGNIELDEIHLYNYKLNEMGTAAPSTSLATSASLLTHPTIPVSEYKVGDLIHNTQVNDEKLLNNHSKILDENGEPEQVYHSTDDEFSVFDITKARSYTGTPDYDVPGFYFSPIYAESADYGYNTMSVFLNIRNPFNGDNLGKYRKEIHANSWREVYDVLKKEGYDGVTNDNPQEIEEIIAFDQNQIKSATDNNGNFDSGSGDIRFHIVGEKGAAALDKAQEATTRMDNLAVAREMEQSFNEGKPDKEQRRKIKLATGWERGADGKWRYEIADVRIKPNPPYRHEKTSDSEGDTAEFDIIQLGDLIEDSELLDAYPQLRDISVKFTPDMQSNGEYYPQTNEIYIKRGENFNQSGIVKTFIDKGLAKTEEEARRLIEESNHRIANSVYLPVLIHEIQHAIQNIEGFARGGNTIVAFPSNGRGGAWAILAERRKQLATPLTFEEYIKSQWNSEDSDESRKDYKEYVKNIKKYAKAADIELQKTVALEWYKSIAGEAEARNASRRMNMTAEEKRASLLEETEDVAREDQIFLRENLGDDARQYSTDELGGARLLKTRSGEVYGFTYQDEVFIDRNLLNANTPVHEFGHLWNRMIKRTNPELWRRGMTLIEGTRYWDAVLGNQIYRGLYKDADNLTEEERERIADEALATAIGDRGELLLKPIEGLGADRSPFGRLRAWLTEVWDAIRDYLGIRDLTGEEVERLTLDEFLNGAVADLLSGVRESKDGGGKSTLEAGMEIGEATGAAAKYYEINPDRLALTLSAFERDDFRAYRGKDIKMNELEGLLNKSGVKAIEKELIRGVVEANYRGQASVPYNELEMTVRANIIPLEKIETDTYADYGMDNLSEDKDYGSDGEYTVVLNMPEVEHGKSGHFGGDFRTDLLRDVEYEARQLDEKTWVAVDKDYMSKGANEATIMQYVGTAGSQEKVEQWIEKRKNRGEESGGATNIGMYGHIRVWVDGDIMYIPEMQSDYFQHGNARNKLIAKKMEEAEVAEKRAALEGVLDKYGMALQEVQEGGRKETFMVDKGTGEKIMGRDALFRFGAKHIKDALTETIKSYRRVGTIIDVDIDGFVEDFDAARDGSYGAVARAKAALEAVKDKVEADTERADVEERQEIEALLLKHGYWFKDGVWDTPDSKSVGLYDKNGECADGISNVATYKAARDEIISRIQIALDKYGIDHLKSSRGFSDEILKGLKRIRAKRESIKNAERTRIWKEIVEPEEERIVSEFTAEERQFVASQKVFERRLLHEAVAEARERGVERLRFPKPHTLAVIEHYIEGSGTPYEFVEQQREGRLTKGDVVSMHGTNYLILNAEGWAISMDDYNEFDVDDWIKEEAEREVKDAIYDLERHQSTTYREIVESNDISDVLQQVLLAQFTDEMIEKDETIEVEDFEDEMIAAAKAELEERYKFDEDIEYEMERAFGYQAATVSYRGFTRRRVITTVTRGFHENLPIPGEGVAKEDFNVDDLTEDYQKVVMQKYLALEDRLSDDFGAENVQVVEDHNGYEWYELDMTGEGVQGRPVVAFMAVGEQGVRAATGESGNRDNSGGVEEEVEGMVAELLSEKRRRYVEAVERLEGLRLAREMEGAFADAKKIKMATGWERGADGEWRYEVDDVDFTDEFVRGMEESRELFEDGRTMWRAVMLSEAIGADNELFAMYPEAKNVGVDLKIDPTRTSATGMYIEREQLIRIVSPTMEALRSAFVHEVQHFVQASEGFETGANHKIIGLELLEKSDVNYNYLRMQREANQASGEERSVKLELAERYRELAINEIEREAHNRYMRSMGETEARNASRRMGMTAEERRLSLMEETEDYGRGEQIRLREDDARQYSTVGYGTGRGMTAIERRRMLGRETVDVSRADKRSLYAGMGVTLAQSVEDIDPMSVPMGYDSVYMRSTGELMVLDKSKMRVVASKRRKLSEVMPASLIAETEDMLRRKCG